LCFFSQEEQATIATFRYLLVKCNQDGNTLLRGERMRSGRHRLLYVKLLYTKKKGGEVVMKNKGISPQTDHGLAILKDIKN